MKKNSVTTIEELVAKYVRRGMDRRKAIEKIYKDWAEGKIEIYDPNPPRDFIEYLLRLDHSLWFWTSVMVLGLTLFTVYFSWISPLILYMRYVLGSIMVLYLPGMALIEALYPGERELSPLERLALSIGLSLAVVPLIGLILNYTPWGIRLNPILVSLTVYTLGLLVLAAYRKYVLVLKLYRKE